MVCYKLDFYSYNNRLIESTKTRLFHEESIHKLLPRSLIALHHDS